MYSLPLASSAFCSPFFWCPPPPLLFLFLFRPGFAPADVSSGEPWRSEERGGEGEGYSDGQMERNRMYVDK